MSDLPVPDREPGPLSDALETAELSAAPVSLGDRLKQPRTLFSIIIPLVMVVLVFRLALNLDVNELIDGVSRANKWLLLAAFGVFYLGFPLRGLRWALLLRGSGYRVPVRDSTEILFLSWLVNCLVPAKLGDVYRAYLLKLNSPVVSLSKTFGTVFIERILDLFMIALLGLAAGFWSFRSGFPPEIQFVVALGLGVILAMLLVLFTMRNFGRRILKRLPLPHRVLDLYDKFEQGVFGAIGVRSLPPLVAITALIWATEGFRLWFVVLSLGFPDVQLGISGAFFVAFIGSLLTAVPLSPAGLGAVELGVVGVLTLAYGINPQEAATIVIVDRLISVFSIVVIGSIAYVLSGKRRGAGLSQPIEVATPVARAV
jgi:glycosyltransferase 2 family protein